MAYLKDCPAPKCAECTTRLATKELFGRHNDKFDKLGKFCDRCALKRFKLLQEQEAKG